MESNQYVPFERNRYYSGKLLTSVDFRAEQNYMNHKRTFLNSLVLGPGVLCGLGVFNLDDLSIMVESGAAIDSRGREIVISSSVVKKLSAIDGFESLTGSRAVLCLRYREEEVHPVYALNKKEQDQEYEYNRIREGFQLFLIDAERVPLSYRMESEFYSTVRLYGDESDPLLPNPIPVTVDLTMPAIASSAKQVRLLLRVVERGGSDMESDFTFRATLQAPAFFAEDASHELEVFTEPIRLKQGGVYTKEFWLTAREEAVDSTALIVKDGMIRVTVGREEREISGSRQKLMTSIQAVSPETLVTREIGKINLEMRAMGQTIDFVPLTEIFLERTQQACMIDRVEESRVRSYIPLPSGEALRREYAQNFGPDRSDTMKTSRAAQKETPLLREHPVYQNIKPLCATGLCEIALGPGAKKGMVKRSGEIVHGLGRGDVYVQLGMEYDQEDLSLGKEGRNAIYGDPRLFADKGGLPFPLVETGVRVMADKGSFMAAVRLLEDSATAAVSLRWVAVKVPDDSDWDEEFRGQSIAVEASTVVLKPGASHYFPVRFVGMSPCSLIYELTEEDSGSISGEGVYTAPEEEGVYEIYIRCADEPSICTYAYAVVRK